MIGIYRYTNLINGKRYIGQSIDIEKRYKGHLSKKASLIDKAIDKYGIENFRFEVLEFCEPEQLNELETYWITYYNTNIYAGGYGYNRNNGGDGHGGQAWNKGVPCRKETKEKIRISKTGKHLTQEHKNNIKIGTEGKHATYGMFGKHQSEHQKKTVAEKLTGREFSEEHKQHLRKPKKNTENMYRQTDKHWYTNGYDNVLIYNEQIDYYENLGYIKGRKISKNNE